MVAGNEDYWKVAIEFFPDSVISDMHKEVLKSIPIGGRDGGSAWGESCPLNFSSPPLNFDGLFLIPRIIDSYRVFQLQDSIFRTNPAVLCNLTG